MPFLARRLAHTVFLLAGVSALSFAFYALAPGDFLAEARLDPQVSPETVAALRSRYGADRPLVSQYVEWLAAAVRGDLGFSFAYNSAVAPLLFARARNTLLLTGTAASVSWAAALALGIWTGSRRGGRTAAALDAILSALLAAPPLLLALAAMMFAARTGLFPVGGMHSLGSGELHGWPMLKDTAVHFFLPVLVLAAGSLPLLAGHVRTAIAEALAAPFIEHLRGLGVRTRTLLFRHALKSAANPLITLLGYSIGTLLSASVLVEVVFGWPGLGPLLLEAILARDLFVVIGVVMLSSVFLVAGNLIADLLLYAVDPRIRAE